MNDGRFQKLNAELGLSFNQFVASHVDWELLHQIPREATVLFQTADPAFNAWTEKVADHTQRLKEPTSVIVFVQVPEPHRHPDRIDWSKARVLRAVYRTVVRWPAIAAQVVKREKKSRR